MALKKCKECGQEVSDKAHTCTHCGYVLKKKKRGIFGQLFKWMFILFNALMAFAIYSSTKTSIGTITDNNLTDAAQTGAVIGTGIGFSMLLTLWVMGAVILGMFVLFTRPKA